MSLLSRRRTALTQLAAGTFTAGAALARPLAIRAEGEEPLIWDEAAAPVSPEMPAETPLDPAAQPAAQPPPPSFAYGMQAHFYYQDAARIAGYVQDAGFGWVKQQVRWGDVESVPGSPAWGPLDTIVEAAAAAGLKVLFSVVTAPAWSRALGGTDGPPDDYAAMADFMSRLATRYAGRVHAYEVWNEQNFAREWGGGRISAGQYVELLKAVYPAVKAADPAAVVISGAPTPTGFNDPNVAVDDVVYLEQCYLYQSGVFATVCDAIGAHAGGFNNPPDDTPDLRTVASTTFKGHMSFYFRRIEQLRNIMALYGDAAKKLWVTEFGWSTVNGARGYEYGLDNTEQDQARYMVRAYQLAREYGWVDGMFVWNLNFQQMVPPADEKWAFGILRADGSPRPAFSALKLMPKLP
ncbi:MAG TPA: cellulase family glycosylhydrolase [Chloroflexota bacterium]|nr:cellulase family glycosylhydrolase [Chloroflexota bacterium]